MKRPQSGPVAQGRVPFAIEAYDTPVLGSGAAGQRRRTGGKETEKEKSIRRQGRKDPRSRGGRPGDSPAESRYSLTSPCGCALTRSAAFYFSGYTTNNGDWTAPQNGDLWRDGAKTLFDPCPAGWQVPRSGTGNLSPWNGFTQENGPWIGKEVESGRYFDHSVIYGTATAWIPCTGVRAGEASGAISWIKTDAHFWSSSPSGVNAFRFYSNGGLGVQPASSIQRSRGNSVRCVRL